MRPRLLSSGLALALVAPALLSPAACRPAGSDAAATDAVPGADSAAPGTDAVVVTDAGPPVDPLLGVSAVTSVAGGFMFLEGPQWVAVTSTLLFSDIPGDTIHELAPPAAVSVFRMPSGNSNGLGLMPDGRLLAAEHGNRRVSIADLGGAPVALADTYLGDRLNSPNDVVARSDGTVYFTDPPYGIADADRELAFIGVFRVLASASAVPVADPPPDPVVEWMGGLTARPNGIALSPDEAILYVSYTDEGVVRAFDVASAGDLSGERILSTDTPGADGLAVDTAGNLFVTTSAGVRVLAPDGTTWGTIDVPEQPANCAFGDSDLRTLYVTARTSLYRVSLVRPGLPTH